MNDFKLAQLPSELKWLTGIFLMVLSIGFFTGINFVHFTTEAHPQGIEENYLGNEDDLEALQMKFKKSEAQMLNLTHTHILSMSVIFFILSILVYLTSYQLWLRKFLMIEPLLSVLVTFGGIYLLWLGCTWMKYVVIASGALMTLSFLVSVLLIIFSFFPLMKKPTNKI
ncbi:MAG: hypothetical protein LAT51_02185 [Flavobacteriaceae bacterium]|nr:hypothetical protein [Flavobacteriaceae bacterium]